MKAATRIKGLTFGLVLSFGLGAAAHAQSSRHHYAGYYRHAARVGWQHYNRNDRYAASTGHSGGHLQCVTFARMDSGIQIIGNADTWWDHATGRYQRGTRPEPASVLSFQANGVMRLGHVAVVTDVINSRTISIDQANWSGPGHVSRDITVVDVSPRNDWSAVRVGVEHTGVFGSIYPTNGFIYDRPDTGKLIASASDGTPIPVLNPAPRDLRNQALQNSDGFEEVAEAPDPGESHWHRRVSYRHDAHRTLHRHHHQA